MSTEARQVVYGGPRGGNILEFYTEVFKPQPSPLALFRQHIIQWFFAAKHLRFFEAYKLTNRPSEEDLASHRMVCASLITFGEFACLFAKQQERDVNLQSVGITIESIEAETRLLRYNFKMFHDNAMTDKEAENVLAETFK